MKQIRHGVFETNSSSTHSICIAKDTKLTLPKSLHFSFDEFGWGENTLYSVHDKASYLYTGLIANDREEDVTKIIELLESKGIEVSAEEPIYKEWSEGDKNYRYADNAGYVDHSDELNEFLNAVCSNEDELMDYLFSDLSFIITGNDNDDSDVTIDVAYPHHEYYKGN